MERRNFIVALIAVPALGLLGACGSDAANDSLQTSDTGTDAPPVTTVAPSTESTAPSTDPTPTTPPTAVSDEDATDEAAAGMVLSYTTPGGFTTREFAFQNPPIALLSSDGTMIVSAPAPDVFPGPLLPQHQVRTVSPAGIESLRAAADAAGLFADIDYTSDDGLLIADAATSLLTITANGTTYTHEAYALDIGAGPGPGGTESTPQRQALLDFLTALQVDPASIIGADDLGEPTDYEPDGYQFIAMPVAGADIPTDATIEPWPTDVGVDLAMATECSGVEDAAIGELFDQATQLTFFEEGGEIYRVTPRPAYPGRTC